ncbi:YnfA family protein [Rosenbergiella australiborealis]|uniref:YnfA family protein n=1 Tax=Rosenbergiella australiborealis TaxID=1544696 RepID=A0ABS5T0Q8_9GAMM|nr:YnfA family protein [Rosenbergiella australiborealis]MBT0725932.1 YnfA family protein [Rosenbergiella australiborealis]
MLYVYYFFLFIVTAIAEIIGCYLPWLIVKQGKSLVLFIPAMLSLLIFCLLLTLHPAAAGRTYAAYGGVYILVALSWLRWVEGVNLIRDDYLGAFVIFLGVIIIMAQPLSRLFGK